MASALTFSQNVFFYINKQPKVQDAPERSGKQVEPRRRPGGRFGSGREALRGGDARSVWVSDSVFFMFFCCCGSLALI